MHSVDTAGGLQGHKAASTLARWQRDSYPFPVRGDIATADQHRKNCTSDRLEEQSDGETNVSASDGRNLHNSRVGGASASHCTGVQQQNYRA